MDFTKRRKELEWHLIRSIGMTPAVSKTCRSLVAVSKELCRLEIELCNGDQRHHFATIEAWSDCYKGERDLYRRKAVALVESLPHTDYGPITVEWPDPRAGVGVRLLIPGDTRSNNFGGEGWDV